MNEYSKRLADILDGLVKDEEDENPIENAVAVDALISAINDAYPKTALSGDYEFEPVVKGLVKFYKMDGSMIEMAAQMQKLIELGTYPHQLEDEDEDKLRALILDFAKLLKKGIDALT